MNKWLREFLNRNKTAGTTAEVGDPPPEDFNNAHSAALSRHFGHIDPLALRASYYDWSEYLRDSTWAPDDPALEHALGDVAELVATAVSCFRGVICCPDVWGTPMFDITLDWSSDYWQPVGDEEISDYGDVKPRPIPAQEFLIIVPLVLAGSGEPHVPHDIKRLLFKPEENKRAVQAFAVVALLCCDQAIEHLLRGRPARCLHSLSEGYRHIFHVVAAIRDKDPDF